MKQWAMALAMTVAGLALVGEARATTWYVHRENNVIVWAGQYPQPDYATEALNDATNADIQAFLAPAPPQQLATILAAGLVVTSTGAPTLSATYALDHTTLDQIGSVARDAAAGLGLPGGGSTFIYPDLSGTPHSFTAAQLEALYKAMRDYVLSANQTEAILAAGGQANWPTAAKTIP